MADPSLLALRQLNQGATAMGCNSWQKTFFNRQYSLERVTSPGDKGANREPVACVTLLKRQ